MDKKTVFVYCWTDMKTDMIYVGRHRGTFDDGYVTSSKHFNKEYKQRPFDFSRQIIAEGTWDDILILERKILETVNAAANTIYYNKHNAGWNFYSRGAVTEEHRKKLSIANKGKTSNRKGIIVSEETKKRISLAKKGKQVPWNKGIKTGITKHIKRLTWVIITPDKKVIITKNIKEFAFDNNLTYSAISQSKKYKNGCKGYFAGAIREN